MAKPRDGKLKAVPLRAPPISTHSSVSPLEDDIAGGEIEQIL